MSALAKRLTRALLECQGIRQPLPAEPARILRALPPPQTADEFDLDVPCESRALQRPGELWWAPRICSVTDGGWVHSYISDGRGGFRPGEGVCMPKNRWRLYKQSVNLYAVDFGDMSDEECPYCGATCRGWNGPVHCTDCNALVCFGRTTADGYFHCRDSCGASGQLKAVARQQFGFVPTLHRGGHPGR
jgi:hypothetical protein